MPHRFSKVPKKTETKLRDGRQQQRQQLRFCTFNLKEVNGKKILVFLVPEQKRVKAEQIPPFGLSLFPLWEMARKALFGLLLVAPGAH